MPQSLAKLYVHLIFSTKHRERILPHECSSNLHTYLGGILRDLECVPVEINTEPDHAHVLFQLGRTVTVANVVAQLKQGSTLWLQEQHISLSQFHWQNGYGAFSVQATLSPLVTRYLFHWQNGYGAFSVSQSSVDDVRQYIRNQEEHHRARTFQEEFRLFLERHGVAYDERYVWD